MRRDGLSADFRWCVKQFYWVIRSISTLQGWSPLPQAVRPCHLCLRLFTRCGACLAYLAVKRLLDNVQMEMRCMPLPHVGGGVWGTLAAGLFYEGDLLGTHRIIVAQPMGIGAMFVRSFGLGMVVVFCDRKTIGLRTCTAWATRAWLYRTCRRGLPWIPR